MFLGIALHSANPEGVKAIMENIMKIRYRDDGQKIIKEVVLQYIPKKEFKEYLTKKEIEILKKDDDYSIIDGFFKTKKLAIKKYQDEVEVMNKSGRRLKSSAKQAYDFWINGDFVILDF